MTQGRLSSHWLARWATSSALIGSLLLLAIAEGEDMRIELGLGHLDRLTRANMRVAEKAASVSSDPLRPIYHLMPAAGSGGDPNGPIYARGKYHMFFQHAPEFEWGKPSEQWEEPWVDGAFNHPGVGWGHVSSADGVYWVHEPIALMPERGSYDPFLCASGCTVIDDSGFPTIFYTAAEPQTICVARSQDPNLRWWLKDPSNPVIFEPPIENYVRGGFRDPFIWREGAVWHMVVCGAARGLGGMAVHLRSGDLTDWEHVGALAAGMGEHCVAWECPNFLVFGDQGVLIVSPLFDNLADTDHAPRGNVSYTTGPYGGDGAFTPGEWKSIDIGGPNNLYASTCMETPDGRRLLWGMNLGGGAPGHHWSTNLSLPRVVSLRPDGLLGQEPPVELQGLRRAHWGTADHTLEGEYRLGIESTTCEIIAEIEVGDAGIVGLDVRGSDDFTTRTRIAYDAKAGRLHIDGHSAEFRLLEGEKVLRLQAFVDNSVCEVFVNRRECGTVRPFYSIEHDALRLFSEGGTARIRSVDLWEMGSVWDRPVKPDLMVPRVPEPWSQAFRLVGDGVAMYSDFALIQDRQGRWHCIGTFGKGSDGQGDGRAVSDGYSLFHAVGNSLSEPMTHLDKINYQIDSPQAFMWAPGVVWNRSGTRAFLYYFHYFGWEGGVQVRPDEVCCRLLISDSPDLSVWRPYDGGELADRNRVFRERDDRDFRVFWDDRLGVYLMYYCSSLASGPRVRTSTDLLHWSEPVTVLRAPADDPHGYAESPFVLYRDGYYYLWVSGIDYSRTSLYISEDPFDFGDAIANRIEDQPGHAPEVVSADGGDYMACSMVSTVPSASPGAHDLHGILIQPLRWERADPEMERRVTRKR